MYPGAHAETTPAKPAVIMADTGETVTYADLNDRSNRLAQLWWSWGVRPGDHVAIFAENHVCYFEVFWAAMRSGLYITTVNSHLSAEEAAYIVDDSGSKVLVTTAAMGDVAVAMVEHMPHCDHRMMLDGAEDGFESYEAAVAAMPAEPLAEELRGDFMLYSSGTTGRPKGIKRPLPGLPVDDPGITGVSSLERFILGMDEESVYLSPAPLYHSAPLAWTTGVHEIGGTAVVMSKFDEARYLELVERYSVTHSQVVPTMFIRMLKLPDEVRTRYDLSSLRGVVHAAAPCPIEVKRHMIDWWGPIVMEYYAGTEGQGMTFIDSEQWLAHPGSVGIPLIGTPHICDEDGNELPTGEAGLIYFENDERSFEYHGDEEKTKESRHPTHPTWAALGDVGYLDEDGFLYLTDRKAFMIISGGVNIYPQEIEDCFALHPKVADVAVFGLPDPEFGEFVQAVVQPADGIEGSEELAGELREYARERIAHFKVPRVIDFRAELPRLPTGKLYKRHLRAEYLEAASERQADAAR